MPDPIKQKITDQAMKIFDAQHELAEGMMDKKLKKPFKRLFDPVSIGEMNIRNRLVMPPMGTNYGSEDGSVTDRLLAYYEERAKGGAGLIVVELTCIDQPVGKSIIRQLAIDDDRFMAGLRELAQTIQRHGARAAIQLHHAGRSAPMSFTKVQPVGPSSIPLLNRYRLGNITVPRELTVMEIGRIVASFAAGAVRAKKAGFDGVEIHGATNYLITNFLSSASNKRKDAYGGELRNRARLLLEIIRAIKQSVGKGYPVWPRCKGKEFGIEGGITLEETIEVARMAEEAGADAIHVTSARIDRLNFSPMAETPGNNVYLAEAVKKAVNIPVITVGNVTPEIAERVLEEGKVDLVAMGSALIADPELPNKLASGRLDDIIPCIRCYYCLDAMRDFGTENGYTACAVNSRTGREREYAFKPADRVKTVLVVGGGPAGLEAARVARLRGHNVKLYDKAFRLGGQLLLARVPPHKDGIDTLINYLTRQVTKLGVDVHTDKEVTPKDIEEIKPDAVIFATGSLPIIPEIPGIDRDNVVLAWAVLAGKAEVADRVVIIGGGSVGCETAELLVQKGKKVVIVEMLEEGPKGESFHFLLERLSFKGVRMWMGVKCSKLTEDGLTIITKEGEKHTLEAGTVVLATGTRSNQQLFRSSEGLVPEVYLAGDCVEPRSIPDAIGAAFRIAHML